MKKKTLLSEAAMRLLFGSPKAEASGESNSVLPDVDAASIPETVEDTETPDVDADAGEDSADTEDLEQQLQELTAQLQAAQVEHAAAVEAVEAARVNDAEKHATEVVNLKAEVDSLKEIVTEQISRMRIGLSLSKVDMSGDSTKHVVDEFHKTSKKFMEALPVGGVVPENSTRKEEIKMTSLDVSSYKSLGF